jgi:hypothetical protein
MPFPVHPHMLRHGCGYALANAGHDTRALQAYLGHKNIQHTVRYTEMAPDRFKELLERLLRLAVDALTRTNRRVHMFEQSVRALALGLLKFRRGR